jgi:hypothetical protein
MMTPTDIARERPAPPPSTSSAQMQQELAEVQERVDHLTREQLADRSTSGRTGGAPHAPGPLERHRAEYVAGAHFSEVRAARAFALLNMAMHDAAVGCWDAKFTLLQPAAVAARLPHPTAIGLPNFPAYTSGHSTFSAPPHGASSYLFPSGASSFEP